MSNDQTLVVLTPGFAHDETDTTCLPLQQSLIKALNNNYPQLHIVILTFQYPYFKKKYNWFGTTVISFNGQNKGGFSKLLLRQKIYKALTEINNNNIICSILSFWCGECALTGNRFADKHGLKHYCWILGQDAKESNKYAKYIKLKADELIALSDFIQQEFKKNHGIRPKHIIPAGIDPKQFDSIVKEKDIDIIAAGSLIPLKRYDMLVHMIAVLKKQMPGIKAVLIGDGPGKKKLQQLIAAQDLQTNIILTGELPHGEVLRWMQRGKIFLHPSLYEGFGVVCAEALYAGCHVISFCQPMKQAIEHWHIVTTGEEMIQQALQILQNPQTTCNRVIFFTVDDIAKKMMELFK